MYSLPSFLASVVTPAASEPAAVSVREKAAISDLRRGKYFSLCDELQNNSRGVYPSQWPASIWAEAGERRAISSKTRQQVRLRASPPPTASGMGRSRIG